MDFIYLSTLSLQSTLSSLNYSCFAFVPQPQNEVDEVLKALDAENDRLMAESRKSYASDSVCSCF